MEKLKYWAIGEAPYSIVNQSMDKHIIRPFNFYPFRLIHFHSLISLSFPPPPPPAPPPPNPVFHFSLKNREAWDNFMLVFNYQSEFLTFPHCLFQKMVLCYSKYTVLTQYLNLLDIKQSDISSIILQKSHHWPKTEQPNECNKSLFHYLSTAWPIYVIKKS